MLLFFFRGRKRLQTCTNAIVFLQEENETVGICANVIVFLHGEKETVDMCTNVFVFLQERDCRHVY